LGHASKERVYEIEKIWESEIFAPSGQKFSIFSDGRDLKFGKVFGHPLPDGKLCELVECGVRNFLRKPPIPGWMNSKDRRQIFRKEPS